MAKINLCQRSTIVPTICSLYYLHWCTVYIGHQTPELTTITLYWQLESLHPLASTVTAGTALCNQTSDGYRGIEVNLYPRMGVTIASTPGSSITCLPNNKDPTSNNADGYSVNLKMQVDFTVFLRRCYEPINILNCYFYRMIICDLSNDRPTSQKIVLVLNQWNPASVLNGPCLFLFCFNLNGQVLHACKFTIRFWQCSLLFLQCNPSYCCVPPFYATQ